MRGVQWRLVMNAIELLKEQHEEVSSLFKAFEKAEDAGEKQLLVQQLCDSLAAHATIEEKRFYPAAKSDKTEDTLLESVEEHLAMKRLIADLITMTPADEQYAAKVTVLKEEVEHHVEEEEKRGGLFSKARTLIGKEQLEVLGDEMKKMFDELMQQSPRNEVPAQTDEAAPV